MGVAIGIFCGANGDTSEDWRAECELQFSDGDSDRGDFGFCVVGGADDKDPAVCEHRPADMDISGAVRFCDGAVMALLFSGAAIG